MYVINLDIHQNHNTVTVLLRCLCVHYKLPLHLLSFWACLQQHHFFRSISLCRHGRVNITFPVNSVDLHVPVIMREFISHIISRQVKGTQCMHILLHINPILVKYNVWLPTIRQIPSTSSINSYYHQSDDIKAITYQWLMFEPFP